MLIKVEQEFQYLIRTMLEFKLSNLILNAYTKHDGEGGFARFGIIMCNADEDIIGVTLNWISGNKQPLTKLIDTEYLKYEYKATSRESENMWFLEKYGKTWDQIFEEDEEDNYDYPNKDESRKIEKKSFSLLCTKAAEKISNILVQKIKDENDGKIPDGRGVLTTFYEGKILMECIYRTMDQVEELWHQLAWKYGISADDSVLSKAINEAAASGKEVMIYNGSTPCNDPEEECNVDIVKVYITPDGSIREHRQHTY